jgi:hypothetical protein
MTKKSIIGFALSLALALGFFSTAKYAEAVVRVKSYYKPSTGRYVQSYYRSNSNTTKLDNYSTRGNSNPYTGKKGYTNPYSIPKTSTRSYSIYRSR